MADLITTLDLLRHGAPEGGIRYRGSLDDPLSPQGWEQMRRAVGTHCPWQAIISSPLQRCAAFARELATLYGVPLRIEPRFREIGFGRWEGLTAADIQATDPQALAQFWQDPLCYPPPDGEPLSEASRRVTAGWADMLVHHAGQHLLIVGHGGMMRLVICHLLYIPLNYIWRIDIPYATLTRIKVYGQGGSANPVLVFHGQTRLYD